MNARTISIIGSLAISSLATSTALEAKADSAKAPASVTSFHDAKEKHLASGAEARPR